MTTTTWVEDREVSNPLWDPIPNESYSWDPASIAPLPPRQPDTITLKDTKWVTCSLCEGQGGAYAVDLVDRYNAGVMESRRYYRRYGKAMEILHDLINEENYKVKAWNSKF